MATVNAIPIELKGKSDGARDVQAAVEQGKEAVTKIYEARFKELSESKNKALDVQKTQYDVQPLPAATKCNTLRMYEYWLDKKIQEFKACVTPIYTYRIYLAISCSSPHLPPCCSYVTQQSELQQVKDGHISELEKQVMALFNFGQKLTTIIANHEHGMYPVYEKSGIRTVQIPSSHKPGALGDDVMRGIRAIMQRANTFLDTHDVNSTGGGGGGGGAEAAAAAEGDRDASGDGGGAGGGDVEALKRELQELRSISQA